MLEKMYLPVNNSSDRNNREPYELKKHDIIKIGRMKFKVSQIYLKEVQETIKRKQEQRKRRE